MKGEGPGWVWLAEREGRGAGLGRQCYGNRQVEVWKELIFFTISNTFFNVYSLFLLVAILADLLIASDNY